MLGTVKRKHTKLEGLPQINRDAAGIDVGNAQHWVAVSPDRDPEPARRFDCFAAELYALADWLKRCGIKTAATEARAKPRGPLRGLVDG